MKIMVRSAIMAIVLGVSALSLAACSQNPFQKEEVIVVSVPKPTTYCYRSLANVDCYDEPVPEKERTLLVPVE